jgi:hypothetical protein
MTFLLLLLAVTLVTFLPYFGDQATRLLRETWDGVIKADPVTGDIRPVGATLLAQELFSMLDDNVPQTQNAPSTINTPPGATGLTINTPSPSPTNPGSNALVINGGGVMLGQGATMTICKQGVITYEDFNLQKDGSALSLNIQERATSTKCDPAIQMGPDGLTISGSMNLNGGFYFWNGVPIGLPVKAGTTTFLARVVSGSGGMYAVNVYGNGSKMPATNPADKHTAINLKDTTVYAPIPNATIPQFNSSDALPAGTWISALYEFSQPTDDPTLPEGTLDYTYEFQPAVWLS